MRSRKTNHILLFIGVWLLLTAVYADLRGRVFLDEFKVKAHALIKDKIGLEGKIGDIEGGIFRDVVLKDVALYGSPSLGEVAGEGRDRFFFSAEAVTLNYRVWDIALKNHGGARRITFISPKVRLGSRGEGFALPKAMEPAWKEAVVFIRDGSFYSGSGAPFICELNGCFRLDEDGIKSDRVKANVLGHKFVGKGRLGFPMGKNSLELEGALQGRGYALKAYLNGLLDKAFVRGSFCVPHLFGNADLDLNFAGNIASRQGSVALKNFNLGRSFTLNGLFEPASKGFNLNLLNRSGLAASGEEGEIALDGNFSALPYFTLNINARHLKLIGLDMLSNYQIKGRLNYDERHMLSSVSGELATSGSIINCTPTRELKGNFEIDGDKIKLNALNYGDVALANVVVSLTPQNAIDLCIKFKGTQLGGLSDLMFERGMLSGAVNGDMRVYGKLGEPLKMDGQLELTDGNFGPIKYNSAKVNLKGEGTTIEFVDSKVYSEGAVLELVGKMDVSDMAAPEVFKDVRLKSDPRSVVLAGVDLIKSVEGEDVAFVKDVGEQFRVNFRTYASSDLPQQRDKTDEMELEYKIGGPKSIKLKMKEREDFLGVEHRVKF